MSLTKLFAPGNVPYLPSLGLLALRLWLGVTMLSLHGWAKFVNFSAMSTRFADPYGVSKPVSLALSIGAELVAAALLAAGAGTRLSALVLCFNMATAFVVGHGARLSGSGNGELAFLYLGGFVALLIAGPGRYSVDQLMFGSRR